MPLLARGFHRTSPCPRSNRSHGWQKPERPSPNPTTKKTARRQCRGLDHCLHRPLFSPTTHFQHHHTSPRRCPGNCRCQPETRRRKPPFPCNSPSRSWRGLTARANRTWWETDRSRYPSPGRGRRPPPFWPTTRCRCHRISPRKRQGCRHSRPTGYSQRLSTPENDLSNNRRRGALRTTGRMNKSTARPQCRGPGRCRR
jgi:hypothetical protein